MTANAARQRELDPEEFFKTNDMAMATYLKMQGHSVQRVLWTGPTCYWVFRVTDALLDATEDFLGGESRVEPREYSKKFSETKKEFYDSRSAKAG
jgi:hypothetical protein